MARSPVVFLVPLALAAACRAAGPDPSPPPAGTTAAAPAPAPRDTLAAERDSLMNAVLRRIAGRESEPAESVFVDIRVLRGTPAGRVPRIMNLGFSRSLGVSCGHCHVVGEWAREDSAAKQVAREMVRMVTAINAEHLARIPDLKSEQPAVNCTTCHRGQVKPALNLASP